MVPIAGSRSTALEEGMDIGTRARKAFVVAASVLAVAAVGACGSPGGSSSAGAPGGAAGKLEGTMPSKPRPPKHVPGSASSVTSTPPAQTGLTVYVYFSQTGTGAKNGKIVTGERLTRVPRSVAKTSTPLGAALAQWLAGPNIAEEQYGYTLAAPPGLRVRSATVSDGIATVDLPRAFSPSGGAAATMSRLGQLVYTATEVPGVKAVILKLDGRKATVFGDGLTISHPLTRKDVIGYFVR
jgi:spore germination protein GerM